MVVEELSHQLVLHQPQVVAVAVAEGLVEYLVAGVAELDCLGKVQTALLPEEAVLAVRLPVTLMAALMAVEVVLIMPL
jgi:hypothetical protein